MQSLIRSKSAGVTGGRGTAGAGPGRDLLYAIKKGRKGCSVCQACNPDNRNVKGEAQWTPVPDQPIESVAMDVFSMPEVHIGKETFDCVVLCVDRHSGYVVAVPARKKGLLAKEVAVMMIRH